MKNILTLIAILSCTSAVFAQRTYTLDKYHARVSFTATHLGISHVEGNFKNIDASFVAKKEDLTDAAITFSTDVNSINTDVEYRDNDLKSEKFFDAAKFPKLTFVSTAFKKINGKNYKLYGKLTMHGVTKPVVFNVIFNGTAVNFEKKPAAGFTITGKLNRLDYGIGGSPALTGVSNEIELKANAEFNYTK